MSGCENEEKKKGKKGKLERILKSRTIVLSDAVSSSMMADLLELLEFMEDESTEEPITVVINSPGGEAYSGLGIYDALRFIKSPLKVRVNGLCASAGILILLAADAENRVTLPHSRFMIHQPSGGVRGQASDIQIEAKEMKDLRSAYFKLIGARCGGKTEEEVTTGADRDQWLNATQALEYGLVSRVISNKSELE
jgi:ATP-dependent Clp protease, protease subunit